MTQKKRSPLGTKPAPDEIRTAREAAQLSQTEAAALCFSELRTWQNWEAGATRMHPAIWAWWRCAVFERDNPHIGARRWKPD